MTTNPELLHYTLEDLAPLTQAYYRLRTVDRDGSFTFSDVIVMERLVVGAAQVEVFPNPAIHEANILIHLQRSTKAIVTYFTLTGLVVYQERVALNKGINRFSFEQPDDQTHIYFVSVEYDHGTINKKLVFRELD